MKKMLKKAVSILLAAVMVFGSAPLAGFVGLELPDFGNLFASKAEATTYSGTCGHSLTWSIDNNGVLTISGTGEMENLKLPNNYPWDSYASSITSVVIEDGVTSIGDSAFSTCRNITSVTIGKGLTSISELAFGYCSKLTNITIPDNITNICDFAFYCCGSLISVEIGSGVKAIEDSAFLDCTVADIYYNGTEEDWNNITIEDFNDCLSDATFHFNSNDEGLYTITYIVEGGTYTVDTYREGDQIRLPDNPAKNGFCFVGWVDENGDIALIPSNMPATNLTFVAVWEIISYTIIFDANGGYFYSDDEKEPIVADVVYGESIRDIMPPDPVREGYTFLGYTDRNGNRVSVPETMPAENLILTALWEPINQEKYTINFYVNGELYDSHSYAEGENIEYPPCPEKAGYTFSGWDSLPLTMPCADISVYALWIINMYTAEFDANGGQWSDGSTTKQFEVEYGSPIVAPDEYPMREGFIFCGWADKYGNGEIISDFGNMEFGAEYEAVWLQDLGFCSVQDVRRLTDNVFSEAHALYEIRVMYRPEKIEFLNSADTSVVVLNRNEPFVKNDLKTSGVVLIRSYDIAGNEISSSSPDIEYEIWNVVVSLTEGEYKVRTNYKNDNVSWESIGSAYRFCMQYDFPPVSEDSSYKIEKYRMDTSGEYSLISSETVKTNASHVSVTPELIDGFTVTSDSVLSAAVESDGSTTLKVYYSRNIYSVKFYDGENLISNSNYYYDSIIAGPVTPVKQGYKFVGWSKDRKTVLSDLGNVPASDIVFYAVFEEAKFNVTFDANGGDGVPENLINQSEGTLTLPSAKPSKPGSVFVGWSTDPMSSKPEYQAGDKVELAEDIKFYAVYTEVTEFNGNHYAVFDLNMTWDEAKTYCESLGGHLMTVTTLSEQEFAETLISERKMNCYWLGGYEESEANWKWVTGETFRYMNWGPGEPNNEGSGEDCIEIYAKHDTDNAPGHWNDMAKEGGNGFYRLSSTGFICEWDIDKTEFNGHSYSVIDKLMTWSEAKAYCESLGGHLVSITSEEENKHIKEIISPYSSSYDFMIGIADIYVEGEWSTWVTGEPVLYTNWGKAEPDNLGGSSGQDIGVIVNGIRGYSNGRYYCTPGQWDDNGDKNSRFRFICEWDSFIDTGNVVSPNGTGIKLDQYIYEVESGEKIVISGRLSSSKSVKDITVSWSCTESLAVAFDNPIKINSVDEKMAHISVTAEGLIEGEYSVEVITSDGASSICNIVVLKKNEKEPIDNVNHSQLYIDEHVEFAKSKSFVSFKDTNHANTYSELIRSEAEYHWDNFISLNIFTNYYDVVVAEVLSNQETHDAFVKCMDGMLVAEYRSLANEIVDVINQIDGSTKLDNVQVFEIFTSKDISAYKGSYTYKILTQKLGTKGKDVVAQMFRGTDYLDRAMSLLGAGVDVVDGIVDCMYYRSAIKSYQKTNEYFKEVVYQTARLTEDKGLKDALMNFVTCSNEEDYILFANSLFEKWNDVSIRKGSKIICDLFAGKIIAGTVSFALNYIKIGGVSLAAKEIPIKYSGGTITATGAQVASGAISGVSLGMLVSSLLTNAKGYSYCLASCAHAGDFANAVWPVLTKLEQNLTSNPTFENAALFENAFMLYKSIQMCAVNNMIKAGNEKNNSLLTKLFFLCEEIDLSGFVSELNKMQNFKCHSSDFEQLLDGGVKTDNNMSNKVTVVACPVDVIVYDSNGVLVANAIDDYAERYDSKVSIFVVDSKKYIGIPNDQDYFIEIVARENGKMDYGIFEFSSENNSIRVVKKENIPLKKDQTFNGCLNSVMNTDVINYALKTNVGEDVKLSDVRNIIPVTHISLSETFINLSIGTKKKINATISPEKATDKTIHWLSYDEDIATVSNDGVITAHSVGNTQIMAVSSEGVYSICKINVHDVNITIRNPSTTTISYGDAIVLHADSLETVSTGWRVEWTASNGNFDMETSSDAKTCKISPKKSGNTTFTVTVYDENGNAVSSDEQTMTSKAGFFDKIIAFFKKLFGLTKVIPQALKYIY